MVVIVGILLLSLFQLGLVDGAIEGAWVRDFGVARSQSSQVGSSFSSLALTRKLVVVSHSGQFGGSHYTQVAISFSASALMVSISTTTLVASSRPCRSWVLIKVTCIGIDKGGGSHNEWTSQASVERGYRGALAWCCHQLGGGAMSIFVQGAASSKLGRGGVQEAYTTTHMNHMIV